MAEFSHRASKGMLQASGRLEKEPEVEGVQVEAPLRPGPPIRIPKELRLKVEDAKKKLREKTQAELEVEPNVMLGNTHVGSLDTLLANDRMEKPRITAWQDEDEESESKPG